MSGNERTSLESVWLEETVRPQHARHADYAAAARRGTIRLGLVVVGETLITLALLWLTFQLVARGVGLFESTWLVASWFAWAVSVRFVIHNRRGIWTAAGETTRDYLLLAERRARRKLEMVRFTLGLLVFQIIVVGILFAWGRAGGRIGLGSDLDIALLAAISAVYVGWAIWYRRRALCELDSARALLAEIESEGD